MSEQFVHKCADVISLQSVCELIQIGGELNDPKLPKTKKSQCYQTFLGAVLCIKARENFEFGEK